MLAKILLALFLEKTNGTEKQTSHPPWLQSPSHSYPPPRYPSSLIASSCSPSLVARIATHCLLVRRQSNTPVQLHVHAYAQLANASCFQSRAWGKKKQPKEGAERNVRDLLVSWLICLKIDIATNNSVQISPADYKAQSYATLVDTFSIVRDPGDGIGNTGINPHSAEESSCVLYPSG